MTMIVNIDNIQYPVQADEFSTPEQIRQQLKGNYNIESGSLKLYYNKQMLDDQIQLTHQNYKQGDPLEGRNQMIVYQQPLPQYEPNLQLLNPRVRPAQDHPTINPQSNTTANVEMYKVPFQPLQSVKPHFQQENELQIINQRSRQEQQGVECQQQETNILITKQQAEFQKLQEELRQQQLIADEISAQLAKFPQTNYYQAQLKLKLQEVHKQSQIVIEQHHKIVMLNQSNNVAQYGIEQLEKEIEIQRLNLREMKRQINAANLDNFQLQIQLSEMQKQQTELIAAKNLLMHDQQIKFAEQEKQLIQLEQQLKEEKQRKEQLELENARQRQELQRSEERRRSQLVESQRLISQMMETHGKIDVCFLVDCTGSMDVYKEQAMKCVEGTLRDIKFKTNRDTLWAAVGYQDFHEYKQLGQYYQTDFNSQTEVVYNFLNGIKCAGGDDATEDIRGGIKQMIRKLNWSHHYKIAVLICDAPNHGKLWNGGCADEYPDEDLTDALQMLIDAKIMLIGIQFTKFTQVMFDRMKQFYTNQNKLNLLFLFQMETIQGSQIHMQLANLISEASVRLTFTNDRSTKQKQDNQQQCKGAIEALSNSEMDPFKFDTDPKIEIVQTTFKVYRTELKNQALEKNILQIDKISLPDDYDITFEAQWQVKRTQIPYTHGQMKSVYLMRRCDQKEELYVIKMPLNGTTYPTLEKALWECRSHLIAQALMNKFINALKQANQDAKSTIEIPNLSYSNFLILQESPNKFWIGERFLKGEFVKYNNNYGFIKNTGLILNQLAQAFSYYTYFISGFNYLVCDIQGVGLYLTDPAINTKVGKFDETDMGKDGIAQFNVTFDKKRTVCKRILQLLRLE